MVDFFCSAYGSIGRRNNKFLSRVKYYAILRLLVKLAANLLVPFYFKLTASKKSNKLKQETGEERPKLIVSLTTFPGRINRIWIVIECMMRQERKPDKIILWLSIEQFADISVLPQRLLKMQSRGLEIHLCEGDLRSHKKYYYALQQFPEDILITVDDDFIYPPALIEELVALHDHFPESICCYRALEITTKENEILPYNQWRYLSDAEGPSFNIFQTSGGGTLYPPGALAREVLNEKVSMELCKNADDIWLNAMAQMNGVKAVKAKVQGELIPFLFNGDFSLSSTNVGEGQNDIQLRAVRNYYIQHLGKDPFINLFTSSK